MKLDSSKQYYDQPYGWVAHPNASPVNEVEKFLVENRYKLNILGGVEDEEASYSYDDWALCELEGKYYLLSTSGCSCPSPTETWRVEIGPATIPEIRAYVTSGAYDGYTLPKKQECDFIALLDAVK